MSTGEIFNVVAALVATVYERRVAITRKRLLAVSLAIGQRIAVLRRAAGLTQEELAERVGSSKATISRLETGRERASLQRLMEIVDVLDADLQDLFVTVGTEGDPKADEIAEVVALLQRASVEDARRAVEIIRALVKDPAPR